MERVIWRIAPQYTPARTNNELNHATLEQEDTGSSGTSIGEGGGQE